MGAESRTMRFADQIIPSPVIKLVNKRMSSTHFATTVHQGEVCPSLSTFSFSLY